jgi:hypothetical protein
VKAERNTSRSAAASLRCEISSLHGACLGARSHVRRAPLASPTVSELSSAKTSACAKALLVLKRITEVMKIMASRRGVGAPWSLLLPSVVAVDVFDDGCL